MGPGVGSIVGSGDGTGVGRGDGSGVGDGDGTASGKEYKSTAVSSPSSSATLPAMRTSRSKESA